MRQPALFRQMDIIPHIPSPSCPHIPSPSCPPPLPVMPAAPPRYARRPFPSYPPPLPVIPAAPPRYARRRLPVIPAGPSVIPAVFSGNPVKTVLLQGLLGRHTPSGKAITAEWRAPWCRTVNEGNVQQEKTMDSRLQTSGMTEGGLVTCLMRTMRQPALFRRMDIIPHIPFPSCPPPPSCHAHRLFPVMPAAPPRHACRPFPSYPPPLPVIPADPSLSFPQAPSVIPAVFSGNPVKTVLLQGLLGRHTPSGKAITAEWRAPWCRTVNEGNVQQEKTMDSRLQTSGMTEGMSGMTRQPTGHRSHQTLDSRLPTSEMTEGEPRE